MINGDVINYRYYSLPLCAPDNPQTKKPTVGETLEGDSIQDSLYKVKFLQDIENQELCTKYYNETDLQLVRSAILQFYYFELFLDDLPVHGFFGTVDPEYPTQTFLFKHIHFECSYNNDRVNHF